MRSFPLQIVTADGMVFDGQAESISVRGTPRSTPRRISTVIPAKQTPGNTAILKRSISAR